MNRGFTFASGEILSYLATECHVTESFNPAHEAPDCTKARFAAMWDTGATKSVITQRVVDACGLKPIRKGFIQGVHGMQKSEAYVVNLYIPDKIVFYELTVVKGSATDVWWDVLIGMDIITTGDFALTNKGGVSMFSFRYPSRAHIDFNKEDAVEP